MPLFAWRCVSLSNTKMGRQLFNVADIKYRCLSNGGHSLRFLNRSEKFIQSLDIIHEKSFPLFDAL